MLLLIDFIIILTHLDIDTCVIKHTKPMFVGQNYNDNAIINTDEVGHSFIFKDIRTSKKIQFKYYFIFFLFFFFRKNNNMVQRKLLILKLEYQHLNTNFDK